MKISLRIAIITVGACAMLILTKCQSGTENHDIPELEAEAAKKKLEEGGIAVVDVRTPGEYEEAHIPDAVNINYNTDTFRSAIRSLPINYGYLLYCESGRRSYMAAKRMKSMGYEQVWHLKNGIDAWEKAGLPLRKPE